MEGGNNLVQTLTNNDTIRIFIDTNTLISFIKHDYFARYKSFPVPIRFVTFEKCLYEWKNGIKRYFLDIGFLVSTIKKSKSNYLHVDTGKLVKVSNEKQAAETIIMQILNQLNLDVVEKSKLIERLKTVDLRFEFGIAEEYQWFTTKDMESNFYRFVCKDEQTETGLLRVKQFFKLAKSFLLDYYSKFDRLLESENIDIIYYDAVFGDPLHILDFRYLLNSSYLPTEDLEIIFSAIASKCRIFSTTENDIYRGSRTLGLNHATNFIKLEFEKKESPEAKPPEEKSGKLVLTPLDMAIEELL